MPGRIRTLKPEWLDDERLALADTETRVLSIALLLLADDYGNGRYCPALMAPRVFPGESDHLATLHRALTSLSRARYVGIYQVDGQTYFTIRNWSKHQRVERPSKPLVPSPPEGFWDTHREPSPSPHRALTEPSEQALTGGVPPCSLDHDHDQRPTTTTSRACVVGTSPEVVVVVPESESDDMIREAARPSREERRAAAMLEPEVPCPKDLSVTQDQRENLRMSAIPDWAIDIMTTRFVNNFLSDPSDKRPIVAWTKCLSKAITGDWFGGKRPQKPIIEGAEQRPPPPDDRPGWVWETGRTPHAWRFDTVRQKRADAAKEVLSKQKEQEEFDWNSISPSTDEENEES